MKFFEIIEELKKGYEVRRSTWDKQCFFKVNGETLMYYNSESTGAPFFPTWNELLATDWEIKNKPETFGFKQALTHACAGKRCANLKITSHEYMYIDSGGKIMMRNHNGHHEEINPNEDKYCGSRDWKLYEFNFKKIK